jgi:hypothetical protein
MNLRGTCSEAHGTRNLESGYDNTSLDLGTMTQRIDVQANRIVVQLGNGKGSP